MKNIFKRLARWWASTSSERYVRWLRRSGVQIGNGVVFHQLKNLSVDLTRPCLISIGDQVQFTQGLTILTHGYDWVVLRNVYGEVLASSGPVNIGSNVFIGYNTTILKGVSIGDNCIIGAGSLVNKSIPPGTVAAGNPARVLCTIDDYHRKRQAAQFDEARVYAGLLRQRTGRAPVPSDFFEEFPQFLSGSQDEQGLPVKAQFGPAYESFKRNHNAPFPTFEAFLAACDRDNMTKP